MHFSMTCKWLWITELAFRRQLRRNILTRIREEENEICESNSPSNNWLCLKTLIKHKQIVELSQKIQDYRILIMYSSLIIERHSWSAYHWLWCSQSNNIALTNSKLPKRITGSQVKKTETWLESIKTFYSTWASK